MIKLAIKEQSQTKELNTTPSKRVVRILVQHSIAEDFEDARTEWTLFGKVDEESREFKENCDLCGHHLYKENWIIQNPSTDSILQIGSDCIKRFIQFVGTSSQSDSNLFFQQREKELRIINDLNTRFKEVIIDPLPTARSLTQFRTQLIALLESKGWTPIGIPVSSLKFFEMAVNVFERITLNGDMMSKLWLVINEPSKVPVQRENRKFRDYQKHKEGQTWRKRSRVTATTLAGSSAFETDFNYKESKWERTSSDAAIEERKRKS